MIDGAIRDGGSGRGARLPGLPRRLRARELREGARRLGRRAGDDRGRRGRARRPGVADSDAILVVAAADWPAVEAAAQAIQEAEDEIRTALNQGQRLADLLDLPE